MDERDQFFQNIFDPNGANAESTKFQRQLSFEDRCVRRVFAECGVKPLFGPLTKLCRAATGYPELSFNWFCSEFSFPAQLCGKRITYVGKRNGAPVYLYQLGIQDLFHAGSNMLARAIAKAIWAGDVDTEQPFIFMFPIVRKMFCAHNLDIRRRPPAEDEEPILQWSFIRGNVRLIVEPSKTLFAAVGNEWYQQ